MDPLALLYNDRSPLENHHVASASAVLLQGSLMVIPVVRRKFAAMKLDP